jgi:hypothetical protein
MPKPFRFRLVFGLLMSLIMSVLMTGWVTWINLGMRPDFAMQWGRAFLMAWPAAFLIAFSFGPALQRVTQRLLTSAEERVPQGPEAP